jgi:vitamin B12/bleomycin/antimicrobial peptide transport system ATP-binding/permease protein
LYAFMESLEPRQMAVAELESQEQTTIATEVNVDNLPVVDRLELASVTLQTPNRARTLIEDLSLKLTTGEGLLVRGPSGCGKSSLLRAIVGLWDAGTGTIIRPPLAQMLFLPQRPYMVLGTLRDQMLYPHMDAEIADDYLSKILIQVNLPNLERQHGGFNTEQNWGQVLSLGEQQRLIFARLLINKPSYAILDEATSALDSQNEKQLYEQLRDSGMTFLSVGHRESLSDYHQSILDISTDRTWSLKTSETSPILRLG